ncbi:Arginine/lysine/ornithine decarboxylase [Seinonella peptonophila]|uniref:Arginine/lysine/ornithine decarboxylase n=1 Tax=Seinonella peptonophila TaxID=112248 RepID=A0A1M4YKF7_9BACL|nr:aminotransferase class V-fold PLP-dependent enzyme [Seinonella peptonophila]SHF06221.1 Arginine/lysine/ornithine decarboxylase [Seinonella peptonophila]
MDQTRAPLWEAAQKHLAHANGNFHVPGHKQGLHFDPKAQNVFHRVLQIDLTEIGELDDLHHATGAILAAEQLAAEAFGANKTFFLVGGSTVGNLVAMMTAATGRKKVVIQRNSHQSLFHGAMIGQAELIVLPPHFHLSDIEKLLQAHQGEIGAVMLTSPSYGGRIQPLGLFAELCHQYHVPLFVDEAHGAHLSFHPGLGTTALQAGADLVVQSTHKMLPAMTMASMLHLQGDRIDQEMVRHYLRIMQSSSPSYPLMISLDLARRIMATLGKEQIESILPLLDAFRRQVVSLPLYEEYIEGLPQDPFKFSLQVEGVSGFEFFSMLEDRGVYAEWADHQRTLFIFTLGTTENDLKNLFSILQEVHLGLFYRKRKKKPILPKMPKISRQSFHFSNWQHHDRKKKDLKEAVGHLSAELIVPYPPGVPLLVPGERWTAEHIELIETYLALCNRVHGIEERENGPQVWVWLKGMG